MTNMTNGIFSFSFFAQSSAVNSQVLAPASYTPSSSSSSSVSAASMSSVFSSSQSSSSFSSSSRTDLFAQSCFAFLTLASQSSSFGSSSSSSQNSAAPRKCIIAKRHVQRAIEKFEKSLKGYTELIKAADEMKNLQLKFQALKDRYITYFKYARALSDTTENFEKRYGLLTQAIDGANECENLSLELGPISNSSFSYYREMPRIRFDQGKILLMLGDDLESAESAFEEALLFYKRLNNDEMIRECEQSLKELAEKRDSSEIVKKVLGKPLNRMDLNDH
jgi:tetratricopeptide (TPR) repeat protein